MRSLLRRPLPTLLASALLAMGVGSALGLFALVHAVLFQPLPGTQGLWALGLRGRASFGEMRMNATPYPLVEELRRPGSPFTHLMVQVDEECALRGPTEGAATRTPGTFVSGAFLGALGLRPILGRDFEPSEERAAGDLVVLSHWLWRSRFGGDPGLLGTTLRINGRDCTVVGVGPEGFRGLYAGFPKDLFLPLGARSRFTPGGSDLTDPATLFPTRARLAPGWTEAQARDALTARLRAVLPPDRCSAPVATLEPAEAGRRQLLGSLIHQPLLLACATSLLLLLACISVALLQLSEALRRKRELLLRLALGAPPRRLAGEAFLRAALPALLGTLGALGFAALLIRTFLHYRIPAFGLLELEVPFGPAVWSAALALALLSTLLVGWAPALLVLRLPMQESLKEGASLSPRQGLREGLVALQVALSLSLLTGALTLAGDLRTRLRVPMGFHPEGLALMKVEPGQLDLPKIARAAFERDLLARARALPGVASATLTTSPPMDLFLFTWNIALEPGGKTWNFPALLVDERFTETLGIPLAAGRPLTAQEVATKARVVLVNEAFVRAHVPEGRAIGRQLPTEDGPYEIVGVLKDFRYFVDEEDTVRPHVFLPYPTFTMPAATLLVRGANPKALLPGMREILRQSQPDLPVAELGTLEDWVARGEAPRRLAAGLLGLFGLLALLLSLAGLGGTLSLQALARRREWGIRSALGATPLGIGRTVLRRGLRLGLAGTALGALGTWALSRILAHHLEGSALSPMGPFLLAALALLATTLLASLGPALAAARVDPAAALRSE